MSRQKRLRNHSLERCSNCCFPFSCLSWYSFLLASILSYFFPLFVLVFPVSSFFFPFPFIFFLISINQLNNRYALKKLETVTQQRCLRSRRVQKASTPTPLHPAGLVARVPGSCRARLTQERTRCHTTGQSGGGLLSSSSVCCFLFQKKKKKKQSQDLTADWQVKGNEKGLQERSNSRQKLAL